MEHGDVATVSSSKRCQTMSHEITVASRQCWDLMFESCLATVEATMLTCKAAAISVDKL